MTKFGKAIAASLTLMMCVCYTPVMAASLNYKKVTLGVGKKKSLKISGAKSVKWSSAKKTIASVSSKGVVTARKKGTTKVYGKVGKKTYTCMVKVVNVPKISSTKVTLKVGATKTLKVLYNTKKVKWSSSKKSVVSVTSKGKISALKAGSATIKAKVGSKTYSCKVTVPKMTLTKTSLTIYKGKTYDLNINNCKATAKWSSSNTKMATVKAGGIVKGVAAGTATITAKVKTTTLKAKVTVKSIASTTTSSTSTTTTAKAASTTNYTTTRTTYTAGVVGQCIKASVKLGSSGTYTTSDKSIALVSQSGFVMPLKAGIVTIKNTTANTSMKIAITDPGSVEVGVDVSYHNGNVDFSKVKAAGADFAIIRGGNTLTKLSTTNSDGIDLNLKTNIDKAQAAGLKYGIYWYMNSSDNKGLMTTSEADAQAAMLATYLKSYQTSYFKLPIYLDLEQLSALISGSTASSKVAYLQSLCEHFTSTLATYGFTDVGIYSSTSWYKTYLQSSYFVNSFSSRWLAHYGYNSVVGTSTANYTSVPSYSYNGVLYYPDLWQTGSDFTIDGISGYVDMNYKYR
jgi:GH25 family lysozyme M1 (1,4-beta-N-acetylmuramidase)